MATTLPEEVAAATTAATTAAATAASAAATQEGGVAAASAAIDAPASATTGPTSDLFSRSRSRSRSRATGDASVPAPEASDVFFFRSRGKRVACMALPWRVSADGSKEVLLKRGKSGLRWLLLRPDMPDEDFETCFYSGLPLKDSLAIFLSKEAPDLGLGNLVWRGALTILPSDEKEDGDEVNLFSLAKPADAAAPRGLEWISIESLDDALPKHEHRPGRWLGPCLRSEESLPIFVTIVGDGEQQLLHEDINRTPSLAPMKSSSALIVTTVSFKGQTASTSVDIAARPLESFIRYHLRRGFHKIMVFIDDWLDTASIEAVRKFPKSVVIAKLRDPILIQEQEQFCASYSKLEPFLETDVSSRQTLDAELAMHLAPELGCGWVVCIDSDELFYTKESSVRPHFQKLADEGVDQMTYLNHEGVPEREDTDDYFASVTLFKKHHFAVPLSSQARTCLRYWMTRSARGQYMLFYDNGKSACQTGLGAKPRSQHLWKLPAGRSSYTALADPRNLDVEHYKECADPCILHFPICGLSWFISKYETLGDFPETWLGKVKLPDSFHTDARALCRAGREALRAKYLAEVVLRDREEAKRQIESGTCLRILDHVALLDAVAGATEELAADQSLPALDATIHEEPAAPSATLEASMPAAASDSASASASASASSTAPAAPTAATTAPASQAVEAGQPDLASLLGIEKGWILSKSMGYL